MQTYYSFQELSAATFGGNAQRVPGIPRFITNTEFKEHGRKIDPRYYQDTEAADLMFAMDDAENNTKMEVNRLTSKICQLLASRQNVIQEGKNAFAQARQQLHSHNSHIQVTAEYFQGFNEPSSDTDSTEFGKF